MDFRVVVRDADSLAVTALFSCLDRVEGVQWSPDGNFVMATLVKRAVSGCGRRPAVWRGRRGWQAFAREESFKSAGARFGGARVVALSS